jgi:membrane-associated protease RseP (regulator of RpoE activity)
VPLLAILLCHEFAHWLAMRRHGIPSTLPLFIPFPNVFGTMGAVIAMRDGVRTRNALVDVGASGPLAGLVVALGVTVAGLARSTIEPLAGRTGVFVEGDSLLYLALKRAVCGPIPPGHDVWLHPVAFAGWVGLFMTMMNLLPIGQLDGGHVAYALFGPRYDRWSPRVIAAVGAWAVGLALYLAATTPRAHWSSELFTPATVWGLWAVMTRVVLRLGGDRHPPTDDQHLDGPRRAMAWFTLGLFAVLFMPLPVRLQ